MPVYEFRCAACSQTFDYMTRAPGRCQCGGQLKRRYSFVVAAGDLAFQPHFNHSVGQVVNTSREFDDALKRGGDKNKTSYARVDPRDMAGQMKDAVGVEEQAKKHRDSGAWEKTGIGKPSSTVIL